MLVVKLNYRSLACNIIFSTVIFLFLVLFYNTKIIQYHHHYNLQVTGMLLPWEFPQPKGWLMQVKVTVLTRIALHWLTCRTLSTVGRPSREMPSWCAVIISACRTGCFSNPCYSSSVLTMTFRVSTLYSRKHYHYHPADLTDSSIGVLTLFNTVLSGIVSAGGADTSLTCGDCPLKNGSPPPPDEISDCGPAQMQIRSRESSSRPPRVLHPRNTHL